MDQHEHDWSQIGDQLRNYQPAGKPDVDFAALQALQREAEVSFFRRYFYFLLPVLLLLCGVVFLIWPAPDNEALVQLGVEEKEPVSATPVPVRSVTVPSEELTERVSAQRSKTNTRVASAKPASPPPPSLPPVSVPQRAPAISNSGPAALASNLVEAGRKPTRPAAALIADSERSEPTNNSLRANQTVTRLPWPAADTKLVSKPEVTAGATISATSAPPPFARTAGKPTFTFGAGLSSHWRGTRFLSDVDNGVYLSIGLEKRFGCLSLDGRVGYRGHSLSQQVSENTGTAWSYYEEKTSQLTSFGEEEEFTYVGVVEGYQGIEFSLLLGYQVSSRVLLQAGGRYALPDLSFRRSVHSSHNGDVTNHDNPYLIFITDQALVKYHDYGGLLGGQYRLSPVFSLEAMLHLGMVDLIEDAGERQSRFNHSSSLSLGIRYRLK